MYGMVNQAVKDLVLSHFGEKRWNEICATAQVPPQDFILMQYYPDEITYSLVAAASKHLGAAPEEILKQFGKYWVLYTAKEGYGPTMSLFGNDFKSCLKNLNNLHARMGTTFPNLTPPRFVYTEKSESELTLEYQSTRAGLGPMVYGLLEGLAEKYSCSITIEMKPPSDTGQIFEIRIAG